MLISEMGGDILFYPGKDNECADMLSRIKAQSQHQAKHPGEVATVEKSPSMAYAPAHCLANLWGPVSIATIDTCEWVAADFPEGLEEGRIPLEADGLTRDRIRDEQLLKYPEFFRLAQEWGGLRLCYTWGPVIFSETTI